MRLSHLIFSLAALGLATVRPVYAEETVSGPLYTVVYFEVAPTEAAPTAAAARQYAEASGKEDGSLAFEMFQEIARPSRFAVVEVWRDKKAAEAHGKAAAATALGQKLQPAMIDGFGVRQHGGFEIAAPKGQLPAGAVYVLTHVDVFPTFKDQRGRCRPQGRRQSEVRRAAMGRAPQSFHLGRSVARPQSLRCQRRLTPYQGVPPKADAARGCSL